MLPGWAAYGIVVFILSALTGIIGWMAQRGVRLIWGMLVAAGIGAQASAFGLILHQRAWFGRAQLAGYAEAPAIMRTRRRAGRVALGLVAAGSALIAGAIVGAVRTSGKPTMS
jgi:hypothetical protein